MYEWDEIDLGGSAHITFSGKDHGKLAFLAVDGDVDFVCLARSLAYHHVLRMPREAGVIRLDIPVPGQAAAAQKNCESRYHGESVHVLCSFLAVPPGSIVQQ